MAEKKIHRGDPALAALGIMNDTGDIKYRIVADAEDRKKRQITLEKEPSQAVTVKQGADGARYMTLVTTNGYKDREDEYITTDALTDWVEKQWDGEAFKSDNKLDFWHMQAPTIGDLVWADMQGTFLVEVYKERASGLPLVQAFTTAIWDFVAKQNDYGASHLFIYDPDRVEDTEDGRVYHAIDKRRSTTLPLEFAANPFTFSGVITMTNEQKDKRDNVLDQALPGISDAFKKLRASLSGAQQELGQSGVQFKAIGPSVTKEDLIDALTIGTKETTRQVLEAATKEEDAQDVDVDVRGIVEDVLAAMMEVPTTTVEDYQDVLDIDADADTGDDAADETEPAPNTEAVDELKALATTAMKAYEDVTADNAALLEQQTALVEALKALAGMPEAVTTMAQRIEKLEKQLAGRSKRASRAAETDAENVAPDLLAAVDAAEKANGDHATYFGLPGKGS